MSEISFRILYGFHEKDWECQVYLALYVPLNQYPTVKQQEIAIDFLKLNDSINSVSDRCRAILNYKGVKS